MRAAFKVLVLSDLGAWPKSSATLVQSLVLRMVSQAPLGVMAEVSPEHYCQMWSPFKKNVIPLGTVKHSPRTWGEI